MSAKLQKVQGSIQCQKRVHRIQRKALDYLRTAGCAVTWVSKKLGSGKMEIRATENFFDPSKNTFLPTKTGGEEAFYSPKKVQSSIQSSMWPVQSSMWTSLNFNSIQFNVQFNPSLTSIQNCQGLGGCLDKLSDKLSYANKSWQVVRQVDKLWQVATLASLHGSAKHPEAFQTLWHGVFPPCPWGCCQRVFSLGGSRLHGYTGERLYITRLYKVKVLVQRLPLPPSQSP